MKISWVTKENINKRILFIDRNKNELFCFSKYLGAPISLDHVPAVVIVRRLYVQNVIYFECAEQKYFYLIKSQTWSNLS